MILKLAVNNQSVESSGITKDYRDALCEYIYGTALKPMQPPLQLIAYQTS